MEKKKYTGTSTGESGGFDGYAGLRLDETYTGTIEGERVHIMLPTGRPTPVSLDQWERWFEPVWRPEPNVPMTAENTDWGF